MLNVFTHDEGMHVHSIKISIAIHFQQTVPGILTIVDLHSVSPAVDRQASCIEVMGHVSPSVAL